MSEENSSNINSLTKQLIDDRLKSQTHTSGYSLRKEERSHVVVKCNNIRRYQKRTGMDTGDSGQSWQTCLSSLYLLSSFLISKFSSHIIVWNNLPNNWKWCDEKYRVSLNMLIYEITYFLKKICLFLLLVNSDWKVYKKGFYMFLMELIAKSYVKMW